MSSVKGMYDCPEDVLEEWMDKLFPNPSEGCINFGFWKGINEPLDVKKRLESQKNLYFELFKKIDEDKKNILEVGSGRGHGVFWLKELGLEPFGIDPLLSQVKKSQNNYPSLSTKFIHGFAENIPFPDHSFDCIISLEAAQHFNFFKFCKEAHRVLRKKGKLIISTFFVNRRESFQELKKIIPDNLEGYHNAITISEAIESLKKAGSKIFTPVTKLGKYVFPLYSKWQKIQLGQVSVDSLSPERLRYKEYYTGGGRGAHPWILAFKNCLIDYYLLEGYKK